MRILVVDDEKAIRDMLEYLLTSRGHEVTLRTSAKQVIENHEDFSDYDVVILDLMMPEVSGSQLLGWVQANEPQVKKVVFTAMSLDHLPQEIWNWADLVLSKTDFVQLYHALENGHG